MSYTFISFTIENSVAKLVLNRPDVLNSFNRQMAVELQDALDVCAKDKNIRTVYLTGKGRAFCAGQDLAEVLPKAGDPAKDLGEAVKNSYNPIVRKIRHLEKPVVCAVNGTAAGAGANIAFACDITFAARSASFIQSFSKIGLIPDSAGTYILPRIVGLQRATAMMFLGEKISAEQALQYGMIYKVCDDNALDEEVMTNAKALAKMPTKGFGLTKRGLNKAFSNNLDAHLDFEEQLQREAGYTYDYNEGVSAFMEKRKPVFRGE